MRRALLCAAGLCAAAASAAAAAGTGAPEINTAQLSLNAAHGQRAELRLGTKEEVYAIGAGDAGFAITHNEREVLSVSSEGEVRVHADVLEADTLTAK